MAIPFDSVVGTDSVLLPKDAVLKFSHQHPLLKNKPLYIYSGANSVKWAYHLNTNVTPTYGGEIVQVLSCNVMPITIEGMTMGNWRRDVHKSQSDASGNQDSVSYTRDTLVSSNDELKDTLDWFLTYMHVAGTLANRDDRQSRDERAILFEYPARGWRFYIQVTALSGFKYALEQQHAAPWSITAEVVSDNDTNYFALNTMERFTDAVTSQTLLSLNSRMADIGFDPSSPTINPQAAVNSIKDLKRFGDNFQGLLAAWSTGDFAHFGFNQLAGTNQNNLNPNTREFWSQVLGSDFVDGTKGVVAAGGLGGSISYSGDPNSMKFADIVQQIVAKFEANGVPGDIGVATALNETGGTLDPDTKQQGGDGAVGLFQTFAVSQATGGPGKGAGYHRQQILEAQQNSPVTKYYPVGMQIDDASSWFAAYAKDNPIITAGADDTTKATFAYHAQQAGDTAYVSKVTRLLPHARDLITQYAATAGGTVTQGNAQELAIKLIASGKFGGHPDITATAKGQPVTNQAGDSIFIDAKVPGVLLYLTSIFGFVEISAVCSDHSYTTTAGRVSGHSAGVAADLSAVNHIALNTPTARATALKAVNALNALKSTYTPVQLITAGTSGTSSLDQTFLNCCMFNGVVHAASDVIQYYGLSTLQGHTNHIHIGY